MGKGNNMKTIRIVAGKAVIAAVFAASMITCLNTFAQSLDEYESSTITQSRDSASQGNRARHAGPPPEAMEACAGAAESDACAFISPRGDEINGTCEYLPGDEFACLPEGGPPGDRNSPDYVPPAE